MKRVFAAVCAAACLTFSAAYADGAFVLDDASLDKVTAGFVFRRAEDSANGSRALAEARANATGFNNTAEDVEVKADATAGRASASSKSTAAGSN